MRNSNQSIKNEKGFTFAEVMICVIIVAMVVGPICMSFSAASKSRATAERINETTNYAATLISKIGEQITNDVLLMQRIEGNRVEYATLTPEEKDRYNDFCQVYLKGTELSEPKRSLAEFLDKMTPTELKQKYNTEKYAYEISLWPLSKAPISTGELKVIKTNLNNVNNKVIKLFSSTDPLYQFNDSFYNNPSRPVTFNVDSATKLAFQDPSKKYIPNKGLDNSKTNFEKYVVVNTIKLKANVADGSNPCGSISTVIDSDDIKTTKVDSIKSFAVDGKISGFEINIKQDPTRTLPACVTNQKYLGIVELDVTALLRYLPSGDGNDYGKYTFTFINETDYDHIFRIKRSISGNEATEKVKEKFNFVTKTTKSGVTSSIQFSSDITTVENYIVAVVVRELKPVVGEKGKIIKKMFDIYSYDPSTIERR